MCAAGALRSPLQCPRGMGSRSPPFEKHEGWGSLSYVAARVGQPATETCGGWPRLCCHPDWTAAPGFVGFEAWAFRLLKAWDVGLLQALFHRRQYLRCPLVTARSSPLMLYLGHGQAAASLLWRGILAFHHDQLLPAPAVAGKRAESRLISGRPGIGAAAISLCRRRLRGHARTRAPSDRRARARRSVGGDEGCEAGICATSPWDACVGGPTPISSRFGKRRWSVAASGKPRFYDFVVFSERKRVQKLRYMHRNPVKRGLVMEPQQWCWSSFRHYAYGEEGPVLVNERRKAELRIRKIS